MEYRAGVECLYTEFISFYTGFILLAWFVRGVCCFMTGRLRNKRSKDEDGEGV